MTENTPVKIAIVGSRSILKHQAKHIRSYVARIAEKYPDATIVSGGAPGVDSIAEAAARTCGLKVEVFRPEWRKNGVFDKTAGFKRNKLIVDAATGVAAFWNGFSKGTKNTIDYAKSVGKTVVIYSLDGERIE